MGEQMRPSWKNQALEVCEAMEAVGGVTWPFSEPGLEAVATTEITEHLRIMGEEGPFAPPGKKYPMWGLGNQESPASTPAWAQLPCWTLGGSEHRRQPSAQGCLG